MNFKKFVASLAVSTMLVGSQVAFSGAMENSPKTEVSQKANSEGRGVVKTVLNVIPGVAGLYNSFAIVSFKKFKLPCSLFGKGNDVYLKTTHAFDLAAVFYSVVQFIGLI